MPGTEALLDAASARDFLGASFAPAGMTAAAAQPMRTAILLLLVLAALLGARVTSAALAGEVAAAVYRLAYARSP